MHNITDQNLTADQISTLTRAMLSVALVDGIEHGEAALIRQFYDSSRDASMVPTETMMASLDTRPFSVSELEHMAGTLADTAMLMCVMTAYADGNLSNVELDHLKAIAKAVHMDDKKFESHLAQVRDQLVGAISHLPDAGSVAKVVKELNTTS